MTDKTTIAPGVTREVHWWGWIYTGHMDNLLKARIAKKSWFSDWTERDSRGRVRRQKRLTVRGWRVEVNRPPTGHCSVQFYLDRDAAEQCYERSREYQDASRPVNRPEVVSTSTSDIAARLDQYVAQAISDYKGKDRRKRKIGIAHGVTRHAHGWCADFFGLPNGLILTGIALGEWFKDGRECKEVEVGGRTVEIYKGRGEFGPIEVSAKYTPAETKRIYR